MSRIRFEGTTPINKGNLNKLNNVIISSTEPTTGEEVWIQKGKNLLSGIIEGYTLDGNGGTTVYNGAYITNFIEVQPNTSYISSGFTNTYKEWYDENFSKINNTTDNPAISPSNAKYLRMNGTGLTDNLQIEQGSTATSYEPYIDKKIHTKNDNGVYEEFYDEENREVYSTSEQRIGTWIDGKPLYRKVVEFTPSSSVTPISVDLSNIERITKTCGTFSRKGHQYLAIPFVYSAYDELQPEWTISYNVNIDSNLIEAYCGSEILNAVGGSSIIIIEYTKTTD